jgi:hypothetical protein
VIEAFDIVKRRVRAMLNLQLERTEKQGIATDLDQIGREVSEVR